METAISSQGGLLRRTNTSTLKEEKAESPAEITPPISNSSSYSSLNGENKINANAATSKAGFKSLKERGNIPGSFYLSLGLVVLFQYYAGVYSNMDVIWLSLQQSVSSSTSSIVGLVKHLQTLFSSPYGDHTIKEYIVAVTVLVLVSSILYTLIYAPLRAGMWTNPTRIKRHKIHRYFGLSFLTLYILAWVEFFCNYDDTYLYSYLPHIVSLNGFIQVHSAFFSFKVLPELEDAGFYSDVAVLSRKFVHENSFFQLYTVMGSLTTYGPLTLFKSNYFQSSKLSSSIASIALYIYIFYPYVLLRPWFPVTSFSNAGTSSKGRSTKNQKFYEYGTTAVKIFYLWAKYFLGFYINFLAYLNFHHGGVDETNGGSGSILSYEDLKFIRGLFLLNAGTLSIAVFLHTLRFKKVLPPTFAFGFYLVQIYLTFSAIPYLSNLFFRHSGLLLLCLFGMACNMTRSKKLHAAWCVMCHYLVVYSGIQW